MDPWTGGSIYEIKGHRKHTLDVFRNTDPRSVILHSSSLHTLKVHHQYFPLLILEVKRGVEVELCSTSPTFSVVSVTLFSMKNLCRVVVRFSSDTRIKVLRLSSQNLTNTNQTIHWLFI